MKASDDSLEIQPFISARYTTLGNDLHRSGRPGRYRFPCARIMLNRPGGRDCGWIQALIVAAIWLAPTSFAQESSPHQQIMDLVNQHAARFSAISRTIWEHPEVGYQEKKASALLQHELQAAGFRGSPA